MSTEKSFLDDNGLQRLWQKVTATVTNSVSAAINALPSWAKAATKPSYTVSEIQNAVSDYDFVKHVNSNLHVSTDDREIWDDVARYHKYKHDLPKLESGNTYKSFSQGYLNTDYYIVAIDSSGRIVCCPNASGSWCEYGTQLADNYRYQNMYEIAIFNNTIYVTFYIAGSGTQLWKIGDDGAFVLVEENSVNQPLPAVYALLTMNYGSSEQLFLIGFDNASASYKRAIYRLDSSDDLHEVARPDSDIHVFSQAKVSSDKEKTILYDSQNEKLMLMIGGEFPSMGYEISIPSGTTISDFCAMNYNTENVFCLVVDFPAKKLYNADFLAGSLVELSDTVLSYWDYAPNIASYQQNSSDVGMVLLMGDINCRYSNTYPYDTYSYSSMGGSGNSMDDIRWLEYCPFSSQWFAITIGGKCIVSSDPTVLGSAWENFVPYLLDKDGNSISDSIRDLIGAMSHDEVVTLFNQFSDGFIRSDIAQSLTDAQKTQARSNIGAEDLLVGDIKASLNESQPDNWLKCDGSPVKISDYPKLGDVVGASIYKASTSKKIGDSNTYYNAINAACKSNVFCKVDNKYYYPLLSADRKSVTIISVADDGSSINTHGTITTSSGAAINTTSNIVWCWNTYNIVLFTVTSVGSNTLTLTYYIAKGKTPDASSWAVSGPYTLTNTVNMPSGITGCDLIVTSDGNNLIVSIGYHDSDGWNCAIAIIPYSLSSARMQHLVGPSTYGRTVSIEYIDHKYFLNKSDTEITSSLTDVENKIGFFTDIDSISIEYLDLDLPSPYQLAAFSFYGFLGVQKIGSKFRAYLMAREDVTVDSSTKYIRSIYVYESNTSDFASYTIKNVYRDVYKTNASFQYLIDSGSYIYMVYDAYSFTKIVLMDPDDPTSYLADYMSTRSTNNSMLWNRWKVLSIMPDSNMIKIISGVFSGSSSPYTLNAYVTSFSDPDKFIVLPSISKDSQGYRYIKAGD